MKHQIGGLGGRLATYFVQTNCLEITKFTMAWKTSSKDVATRVGRFALHIIFLLGPGGSCVLPLYPSQMTPLFTYPRAETQPKSNLVYFSLNI